MCTLLRRILALCCGTALGALLCAPLCVRADIEQTLGIDLDEKYQMDHVENLDAVGRAVQLLSPNGSHDGFTVVQDGIDLLATIPGPIAVVTAVGNIHTGKSFLLNQLRKATNGFPIGRTIDPGTFGIWLWSEPVKIVRKDGSTVNLLLIDTEGFHGPGANRTYDQALFAITTLLATEVIFVTMKMMDSRDMEYLEELAKDANLFSLRAHARHATALHALHEDMKDSFARDPPSSFSNSPIGNVSPASPSAAIFVEMLSPKSLTWVIQSFHHTLDAMTPLDWLEWLARHPSRSGGEIGGGLGEDGTFDRARGHSMKHLYDNIDCEALSSPGEVDQLNDLDHLNWESLRPEYVQQMGTLRERIWARAARFTKHKGKVISPCLSQSVLSTHYAKSSTKEIMSGADLADLLRFLVRAANEKYFRDVDKLLNQVLLVRGEMTRNDLLTLYQADMENLLAMQPPPLIIELETYDKALVKRLRKMWTQHIAGIENSQWVKEIELVLTERLVALHEDSLKRAHQQLSAYCSKKTHWAMRRFEVAVNDVRELLPMNIARLHAWIATTEARQERDLLEALNAKGRPYDSSPACKHDINLYKGFVTEQVQVLQQGNDKAIQNMFETAIRASIDYFYMQLNSSSSSSAANLELPLDEFGQLVQRWYEAAHEKFNHIISEMRDLEDMYNRWNAVWEERMKAPLAEAHHRWEERCLQAGQDTVHRWEVVAKSEISSRIKFPVEEMQLATLFDELKSQAFEEINELYCSSSAIGIQNARTMGIALDTLYTELELANLEAIKKTCEDPLNGVRDALADIAPSYYRWSSFSAAAKKLATRTLHANILKNRNIKVEEPAEVPVDQQLGSYLSIRLSYDLVDKVTDHWLKTDLWDTYYAQIQRNFWAFLQKAAGSLLITLAGGLVVFGCHTYIILYVAVGAAGLLLAFGFQSIGNFCRTLVKGFIVGLFDGLSQIFGFELTLLIVVFLIGLPSVYLYKQWGNSNEARANDNGYPRHGSLTASARPIISKNLNSDFSFNLNPMGNASQAKTANANSAFYSERPVPRSTVTMATPLSRNYQVSHLADDVEMFDPQTNPTVTRHSHLSAVQPTPSRDYGADPDGLFNPRMSSGIPEPSTVSRFVPTAFR